MRGNHHLVTGDRAAVRLHADRVSAEFARLRMLVDAPAGGINGTREAGEVLARMEACLILEADTLAAHQWHIRYK